MGREHGNHRGENTIGRDTHKIKKGKERRQKFQEIKTSPVAFGVQCAYKNFNNLGVDRWLAILAIDELDVKNFIVIDVGTALTCDFVQNKVHLGGWIAPGFDLMRQSLQSNTEQVFIGNDYPNEISIGNDTPDCVNFGCLAYLKGCISQAEQYIQHLTNDYALYITGGSRNMIMNTENEKHTFASNLVLKGLARFAKHQRSSKVY